MSKALREFTRDEVREHSTPESCWIIVQDRVYDVTPFLDEHPAGADLILCEAGRDATVEFQAAMHSEYAEELLEPLQIGVVVSAAQQARRRAAAEAAKMDGVGPGWVYVDTVEAFERDLAAASAPSVMPQSHCRGRRVTEVDGERVAVFLLPDGQFRAVADACPHAGGRLSLGEVVDIEDFGAKLDAAVVCPWHGWMFSLWSGHSNTAGYQVQAYAVEVVNGRVFVTGKRSAQPASNNSIAGRPVWNREANGDANGDNLPRMPNAV